MSTEEIESAALTRPKTDVREEIPETHRWNLADIFPDWDAWQRSCERLEELVDEYAGLRGTLAGGAAPLLRAMTVGDEFGQLSYKVYFYPSLRHDEDQRDNTINARRQQANILLARAAQAAAWFNPELLQIPHDTIRQWMSEDGELRRYRFALEEIYRQQEHVLDEGGEHLMSLGSLFRGSPSEVYSALTTADVKFPAITLDSGEEVTVTAGRYREILATNRCQQDRAAAFEAHYEVYRANINTHAALYNAVAQRDWFSARARSYSSTLSAALHGNNIPLEVVETLIDATRGDGTAPLRRYHRLRKRVLDLPAYHLYDSSIPLVETDRKYPYDEVRQSVVDSVAPLGQDYQRRIRRAFDERWIDVYENKGKRSGAYSAGVYGVHPYVLMNYNDTLSDMFTLAHELGHSMHTILSHGSQPFVYASYTIFVAEVASTLNEALLLELLLARTDEPLERAVLLQHAVDSICGTFYTQVLFADWELQAHRLVEEGQPLTAENLSELYQRLLTDYYGDVLDGDERYAATWARIPHFFNSPYYVYQYATCFASSARILEGIRQGSAAEQAASVKRYVELLEAGSSDHPMTLLQNAGADLTDATTVQAVVHQLDRLVGQLEGELDQIS